MQEPFPSDADGQKIHDLGVIRARETRLPTHVSAPRGPAANPHQHRAEIRRATLLRDGQCIQRCGNQRVGFARQLGQPGPQPGAATLPRQPVICIELLAPATVQPRRGVHGPGGLVPVKKRRAVLADLVRDQRRPAQARARRRATIAHVRDQGNARHAGRLAVQPCDQILHQVVHPTFHPCVRSFASEPAILLLRSVLSTLARAFPRNVLSCGGQQVPAPEVPGRPLRAEPLARHGQPRGGQSAQCSTGLGDGAIDPAPVGVDRDELVQRPGGCDARRG